LTFKARQLSSLPFKASIAFGASSAEFIVTKANPRGRPVVRSVTRLASTTVPYAAKTAFAAHSTVTEANLMTDRATGRPRGFGFVTMGSPGFPWGSAQSFSTPEKMNEQKHCKNFVPTPPLPQTRCFAALNLVSTDVCNP
jgi:hypothetical protein